MENRPFFSIGIASYNYANDILKNLKQLKKQKYKNFEVIISDDHSTDNSLEVIDNFIRHNPEMNIRLITKKCNEGLIANKNTIIENHRGEYLLLCDADDWMEDDLLIKAYNKIVDENPDRLICDIAHIDIKGNIIQREHATEYQSKWGWLIHHASFYKSSIIRDNDLKICGQPDDVFFIINFSRYCKKLSILNDKVYYYWTVHLDSAGRSSISKIDDKQFKNLILSEKKLIINEIYRCIKGIKVDRNNSIYTLKDLEDLKLVYLKLYCFDILFRMQSIKLKDKIKYYKRLNQFSKKYNPKMWECSHVYDLNDRSLRTITMIAIRMCCILEKTRMMIPFLCLYHLITRFVYIDQ